MDITQAQKLDREDPLAPFQERFYVQPDSIYMDGNSLGLLSKEAEAALLSVMDAWKTLGIQAWTEASPPWFTLAEELGSQMAACVGADPDEVIVTNSTTVNLHQLLATFYQPTGSKLGILADALNFPSDLYAITSHLRLRGVDPETHISLVPSQDGFTLSEEKIIQRMDDNVQIAILPSVLYQSGQLLDIPLLTREAHERGILMGIDCSHSAGVIPHHFSEWGVDFAVWSTYKYLNSGPGGTAGLYLNRRHFSTQPGLMGWFSSRKDRQFDMALTVQPASDAGAMQIGTPNILSMAPLIGTLNLAAEAGIERIRQKSLSQTDYLMALTETYLAEHRFKIVTPRDHARRGGHMALVHPEALRICKALRQAGVIPDYRPAEIIRLAPAPLYTTFVDCYGAIQSLAKIMSERSYEQFATGRDLVS